MVSMNTKPGSSMAQTNKVMARINSRLDSIPEIEYSGAVGGFSFSGSGPSQAMYFMTLTDWDRRKDEGQSVDDVIGKIYAATADVPDATVFAMSPPMIAGYGMGNGFELYLQDKTGGDVTAFKGRTDSWRHCPAVPKSERSIRLLPLTIPSIGGHRCGEMRAVGHISPMCCPRSPGIIPGRMCRTSTVSPNSITSPCRHRRSTA